MSAPDTFVPLPDLPSRTSPDLVTLVQRITTAYTSADEEIADDWLAAKAEVAAFPCRTGADLAIKLMVALHEIGPGRSGDRIGYMTDEFVTDLCRHLIEGALKDALALGADHGEADAPIHATWRLFAEHWWCIPRGADDTRSFMFDETVLSGNIATTPAGVAAKLRYALTVNAAYPWLEAAALGGSVPDFDTRLENGDVVDRTLWSAIRSLEAMEGRP